MTGARPRSTPSARPAAGPARTAGRGRGGPAPRGARAPKALGTGTRLILRWWGPGDRLRPGTARYTRRVEAYRARRSPGARTDPVRAWDEGDEILRERAERRAAEDAERRAELQAQGIDLDPTATEQRSIAPTTTPAPTSPRDRHGDPRAPPRRADARPATTPHPRGAGRAPGRGHRGGGRRGPRARASRSTGRAGRWAPSPRATRPAASGSASACRACRAFAEAHALVDDVDLVILAVPDDVGRHGRRRACGCTPARRSSTPAACWARRCWRRRSGPGRQAGAFHPLVAFADLDRALAALHGATIAIEGDDDLAAHLAEMAEAIGGSPVRLAPGSKAAYHAAAVLAAGGVVALLDTIREIAAAMGLDEAGALRIYLPLLEQTVANARALGVAAALTGPATRGDAGTVAAHLAALRPSSPGRHARLPGPAGPLRRPIAEGRGALAPEAADALRAALAGDP